MKVGSLVVPKRAHGPRGDIFGIYTCVPFYPTPSTVCTVKTIDKDGNLWVEETEVLFNGRAGMAAFEASNWREISPPNENSSIEEVKEILENSSVATV